jgi:hypothetical protein
MPRMKRRGVIALQTLIRTRERAGETPLPRSRSHPVYDPKVDEAESEDLWLEVVQRTAPRRRLQPQLSPGMLG